jgi:hypothetical protein
MVRSPILRDLFYFVALNCCLIMTVGWTAGVRSPIEAENFSSSFCVQTGSGAHPSFYSVGIGDYFPGGKRQPERDADHSPPSSAEVKKE